RLDDLPARQLAEVGLERREVVQAVAQTYGGRPEGDEAIRLRPVERRRRPEELDARSLLRGEFRGCGVYPDDLEAVGLGPGLLLVGTRGQHVEPERVADLHVLRIGEHEAHRGFV